MKCYIIQCSRREWEGPRVIYVSLMLCLRLVKWRGVIWEAIFPKVEESNFWRSGWKLCDPTDSQAQAGGLRTADVRLGPVAKGLQAPTPKCSQNTGELQSSYCWLPGSLEGGQCLLSHGVLDTRQQGGPWLLDPSGLQGWLKGWQVGN